jgi:hypothetical protein
MTNIVTSRFNNSTWEENCSFRDKHKEVACIYGSPQQMTEKIPLNSLVFVVEMNNSTNKVEGIGLIRNLLNHEKKMRVYQTGNYNRYTYQGNFRIDRCTIEFVCPQILQILEKIVFTGKTHLKRGAGFTRIPEKLYKYHKILENYNYTEQQIKYEIAALFKRQFSKDTPETQMLKKEH